MKKTSPLAVTSLICGIAGFFFCITAPVAIVTGHMARGQIKKDPNLKGEGMALAGLIMGYFTISFVLTLAIGSFLIYGQKANTTFYPVNQQVEAASNTSPTQTQTNVAPSTNAP